MAPSRTQNLPRLNFRKDRQSCRKRAAPSHELCSHGLCLPWRFISCEASKWMLWAELNDVKSASRLVPSSLSSSFPLFLSLSLSLSPSSSSSLAAATTVGFQARLNGWRITAFPRALTSSNCPISLSLTSAPNVLLEWFCRNRSLAGHAVSSVTAGSSSLLPPPSPLSALSRQRNCDEIAAFVIHLRHAPFRRPPVPPPPPALSSPLQHPSVCSEQRDRTSRERLLSGVPCVWIVSWRRLCFRVSSEYHSRVASLHRGRAEQPLYRVYLTWHGVEVNSESCSNVCVSPTGGAEA